ncbi:Peptidase family M48 [Marinactinospora thermotolerans DSM 45154]|uniref:Peptidase family M48 n=1 Tax=Marinactinospora thermotolerans DSM 45154 TaxID=1122192 RepID=A0A1T4P4I4_9ACTN|nr:M48 family metalloprotease [Marinactinospora thermotolerans]SJZ86520.1 Peptidase family M48 [Marinactinospora thermotolerans DSM 45154]
MTTESGGEPRTAGPARPDPFRLPAATTAQFAVLLLTSFVGAVLVYEWVFDTARSAGLWERHGRLTCAQTARARVAGGDVAGLARSYTQCVVEADRGEAFLLAVAALVPLAASLLLHLVHPCLIRRGLRPHEVGDEEPGAAPARAELESLLAGRRGATLLVTPGTAGGARAFGAFGRHYVAIDRRLLLIAGNPSGLQRLRAVVRHEAAHILGRDVGIAYVTVASWWAFLLLVIVPALLLLLAARPGSLQAITSMAVTPLLLYVARARLLRTREHYADVRAGQDPQAGAELDRLLAEAEGEGGGAGAHRRIRERVGEVFRSHPSVRRRRRILADPGRLLTMGALDLALVATVTGYGFTAAAFLLDLMWLGPADPADLLVGFLFGVPAAFVIVSGVWRAGSREARLRGPRPRALPAATALTAGLLGGQLLAPAWPAPTWGTLLRDAPDLAAAMALLLWGASWCFIRWVILSARGRLADPQCPRRRWGTCLLFAAPLSAVGLTTWFHGIALLGEAAAWSTLALLAGFSVFSLPLPALLAVAAVLPLAGTREESGLPHPLLPALLGGGPLLLHAAVAPIGALLLSVLTDAGPRDRAVVLPVLWWAVAAILVVGAALVLGALVGGRRGSGGLLCATAVMTMFAAAAVLPAFLLHLALVRCGGAGLTAPLCLPVTFADLFGALTPPLFARAVVLVFAGLFAVCGPVALLGAWLRGRPPRPAAPPAGRRRPGPVQTWSSALLPAVLFLLVLLPFETEKAPTAVSPMALGEPPAGRSLAWQEVCRERGVPTGGRQMVAYLTATERGEGYQAARADALGASDDPVLAALGQAARGALERGSRDEAAQAFGAASHYCAVLDAG